MKPFSLDLRALALWRMALGAVVLLDIVMRATDLQAFYGDDGDVFLAVAGKSPSAVAFKNVIAKVVAALDNPPARPAGD